MTEMQRALAATSNLPSHVVGKNPAGTWSFVGRVDARLMYFKRDGSEITLDEIEKIRQHGAGLFRKTIGMRTWPTREAAIEAAEAIGAVVSNK